MSLVKTLGRLIELFERAEVRYMLSGSVASSFYGINRTTQDMDLVIDPNERGLKHLIRLLSDASFYVSDRYAMDALRRRTQFNVIDIETAWKADLVIKKDRPFSVEEFSRRVKRQVLGLPLWITTIEDAILSKLEWSKATGSERQLGDVKGMISIRNAEIDWTYLMKWADVLGVSEQLAGLRLS